MANKSNNLQIMLRAFIYILLISLVSCNLPSKEYQVTPRSQIQPGQIGEETSVMLRCKIGHPLLPGETLVLTILDEVTGLPYNQKRYTMKAEDDSTYSVRLSGQLGSVIKYRYAREGAGVLSEISSDGTPIRYRMFRLESAERVDDIVTRWSDYDSTDRSGRISGQVLEFGSEKPIPNILISAGSEQVFSSADGTFHIEGLPAGTQHVLFYAIDGAFVDHQQNAIIEADSTTNAVVHLQPSRLVTVIFALSVPADTPDGATIHLAGNLYQLGNTFADLPGGVGTLTERMPIMGKLTDRRYLATMSLPAGAYIEYKYTLGDGLWSSELAKDGSFFLRHIFVPEENTTINDVVATWHSPGTRPLRFELKAPFDTPDGENISIQFNPGVGWYEALPMQSTLNSEGINVWRFDLTGPFKNLDSTRYRYCRQAQCGITDDQATVGADPLGRTPEALNNSRLLEDDVLKWTWFNKIEQTATITDVLVIPREPDFMAGVAYTSNFNPSWTPTFEHASKNVKNLNLNWLILSPTWTFADTPQPMFRPVPSQDMLWTDLVKSIEIAQNQGLSVGLYPQPNFLGGQAAWWQKSTRDFAWWNSFFEEYTHFVLNNAGAAAATNSSGLILGGAWLNPALPSGKLADGTPSNSPQDSESRWRELINQVRQVYPGKIAWMLQYPEDLQYPPPFMDTVDQIYIQWSAPIASNQDSSLDQMHAQANQIMNQAILPLHEQLNKPIIIAIAYPSISGAATGCIPLQGGGCLDYDLLSPPNPDINVLQLSLQDQAKAYHAVLSAINDNAWISGYVSMGFYPPAMLQDKSLSINGKPASGVVWFWSQRFLSP